MLGVSGVDTIQNSRSDLCHLDVTAGAARVKYAVNVPLLSVTLSIAGSSMLVLMWKLYNRVAAKSSPFLPVRCAEALGKSQSSPTKKSCTFNAEQEIP